MSCVCVCVHLCICKDAWEMRRVIILLLPWGLSQPRGLPISPLTNAWTESRGPLIGPCDNTRKKGSVFGTLSKCVCVCSFTESCYFLQVLIYWLVFVLWRGFDLYLRRTRLMIVSLAEVGAHWKTIKAQTVEWLKAPLPSLNGAFLSNCFIISVCLLNVR